MVTRRSESVKTDGREWALGGWASLNYLLFHRLEAQFASSNQWNSEKVHLAENESNVI
jgi:hypothetical protein